MIVLKPFEIIWNYIKIWLYDMALSIIRVVEENRINKYSRLFGKKAFNN